MSPWGEPTTRSGRTASISVASSMNPLRLPGLVGLDRQRLREEAADLLERRRCDAAEDVAPRGINDNHHLDLWVVGRKEPDERRHVVGGRVAAGDRLLRRARL